MEATSEVHGDIVIVKIKGEFFIGNIQQIEALWDSHMANNPKIFAIDCSEINFIDSSAIGTLVKFLNNSEKFNVKLIFLELSESILRIFQSAKLNKVFTLKRRSSFDKEYGLKK